MFGYTVQIMALGMGLTFAALGIIVLAMAALTRWTHREEGPAEFEERADQDGSDESEEEAVLAVAAAVAVARARASRARSRLTVPGIDFGQVVSPWQAYARTQKLDQRRTHQTLRW